MEQHELAGPDAASGKAGGKRFGGGDTNGSRECAPDDWLRIEPGISRFRVWC